MKRRSSPAYERGYNSFKPDRPFKNIYQDEDYQSEGYYYRCGWERKKKEYEESKLFELRRDCPYCGGKLEERLSGEFCESVDACGYHTHKELL